MSQHDIRQIPSTNDLLIITAEFPHFTPEALYDYWTTPDLLRGWWPEEVHFTPPGQVRQGSTYHLAWPRMGWNLRGEYTVTERGRCLAFTWQWDHESGHPVRSVRVHFDTAPSGGTCITLTHATYSASEHDQAERGSHFEGWLHFLQQLQSQGRSSRVMEP